MGVFLLSLPSFPCTFFFSSQFSRHFFSDRCLLDLRSTGCPGIGNYKRYRICRGISHMSNMVALQALELLEGWKFWRWKISEVSLYSSLIMCLPSASFFFHSTPGRVSSCDVALTRKEQQMIIFVPYQVITWRRAYALRKRGHFAREICYQTSAHLGHLPTKY